MAVISWLPSPAGSCTGSSTIPPSPRRLMTHARVMSPSSNAPAHQQPEPQHMQRHTCQSTGWMGWNSRGTSDQERIPVSTFGTWAHLIRSLMFKPMSLEPRGQDREDRSPMHSSGPPALLNRAAVPLARLYIWVLWQKAFKDTVLQLIQSLKNPTYSMMFKVLSSIKKEKNLWTIIFELLLKHSFIHPPTPPSPKQLV